MERVYQFRISLAGIEPKIWRQVRVSDLSTFEDLHHVIQLAMGWENAHLYEYRVAGFRIGMEDDDGFDFGGRKLLEASEVNLNRALHDEGDEFFYVYDFGDDWRHMITLEKIIDRAEAGQIPVCLAGGHAAPPEDCGGAYGYEMLLEALSVPKHPEHADMQAFYGAYNPAEFDMEEVNDLLEDFGAGSIDKEDDLDFGEFGQESMFD